MNNRKIIFVRILHQVLFSLHKMKEYSFIKAVFDEFELKKKNYLNVKYDYEHQILGKIDVSGERGMFEYAPISHLYYDVAMDICLQQNYEQRIFDLGKKFLPEDFETDCDIENIRTAEEAIYQLEIISKNEMMELAYLMEKENDNLYDELKKLLEIEDLENDKIYNKYIDKQQRKIYALSEDESQYQQIYLYRKLAAAINANIRFDWCGTDRIARKYGYLFKEFNCIKELKIIEKITKEEIAKYLLNRLEDEEDELSKTQIIRFASLKDYEIEPMAFTIQKTCVEYFYFREIANINRKKVLDEIFGIKKMEGTDVFSSKELFDLRNEKKKLLTDKTVLKHEISELRNEIGNLKNEIEEHKKRFLNKDKEYEIIIHKNKEEYDKEIKQKDSVILNYQNEIFMWKNWWILQSAEPEDEEDIKPYDLEELQQKRILIIGGRFERIITLKKILPQSTFITSENDKVPSGEFDLIFFFNNFMNHSLFAKYIKKARAEKINVGYTLCTNIEKVLSDIYEGLKGSKVMKLK